MILDSRGRRPLPTMWFHWWVVSYLSCRIMCQKFDESLIDGIRPTKSSTVELRRENQFYRYNFVKHGLEPNF